MITVSHDSLLEMETSRFLLAKGISIESMKVGALSDRGTLLHWRNEAPYKRITKFIFDEVEIFTITSQNNSIQITRHIKF